MNRHVREAASHKPTTNLPKKACKEPAEFSTDSVKRQFLRPNRPKIEKIMLDSAT
jgi:hypothetical protein